MLTQRQRNAILARYGFAPLQELTPEEARATCGCDRSWERDTAAKAPKRAPAVVAKPAPVPVVVRPLFGDVGTLALDRDTEAA